MTTLVLITFWFARLESGLKRLATAREEDKKAREEHSAERDARLDKLEAHLAAHRENAEIHFNMRLHQEVERRQDDRFNRVESRLEHIEGKLDQLIKR